MTAVATFGATSVTCAAVPVPPKKHRNFRVEDELWFAFAFVAEMDRERTSDRIRRLLREDVRKHQRQLNANPKWQTKLAELREQAQRDE